MLSLTIPPILTITRIGTEPGPPDFAVVRAVCEAPGARVEVARAFIYEPDIEGFVAKCQRVCDGEYNVAKLGTMEPGVRFELRRADSLGHFDVRVDITPDELMQEHVFLYGIDQTYLPAIATEAYTVLMARP